ncbi:hypothetical protein ACP4OV_016281 [Aristida adscensionis]
MDVLRFVRGVRPPAPPPAAAPPSTASPSPPPPQLHAGAASPAPGFHSPLLRLRPRRGGGDAGAARADEARDWRRHGAVEADGGRDGNWVLQILRVQVRRAAEGAVIRRAEGGLGAAAEADASDGGDGARRDAGGRAGADCEDGCGVGGAEGFDRAAFSRLLRKVSIADAKLYSKMSYLCNFAYMVPRIKPKYLQKYKLKFVTSSVQEKTKVPDAHGHKPDQEPQDRKNTNADSRFFDDQERTCVSTTQPERTQENGSGQGINALAAYQVAASAASYLQSQAMGVIPFGSRSKARGDPTTQAIVNGEHIDGLTMDEASFVATTNSMTSMVAAKEETKQSIADDLNSSRSCPCEWFICDDNRTRYFVVQGSETIASWQANLLFEPVKFEGLDVLVHRGIYEAAKGIYQQLLPYVKSHLKNHGRSARLQFSGHSLGGSLALLVNLMLLMRGVAPAASLLPVITFGAPSIMCGGDYLLQKLGLPKSHVKSITMHRDIVPRAFSCHYPDHISSILKLVNGNFRNHPCLTNQKLLYAPMGQVIILQPDEKLSPHHHLLPEGSGLYLLGDQTVDSDASPRVLESAVSAFFNSPHPLEILSDSGAYGPKGTVYRDHDVHSYVRSVRAVLRKEMKLEMEKRRLLRWPIQVIASMDRRQLLSQLQGHAHLLLVFLLPAKLLVLGIVSAIRSN